jgi:hypothetical protein
MSQSTKEITSINQIITFSQFNMYSNTLGFSQKKKKDVIYITGFFLKIGH